MTAKQNEQTSNVHVSATFWDDEKAIKLTIGDLKQYLAFDF